MIVKLIPYPGEAVLGIWFDSDLEHRNTLWVRRNYAPESQITQLIRIAARNYEIRSGAAA